MNNDKSFVKLNRKITQWEWFQDGNVLKVWIFILTNCNWKEKEWQGITIEKGSFLTSQKKIEMACNLSRQQVRGVLAKLERTREISLKTTKALTKGYTIIKVNNWGYYQDEEIENNLNINHQTTNEQPSNNHQTTITKNTKNAKNTKKDKKEYINNIYIQEFEKLWNDYPVKQGKQYALKSYIKARKKYSYEEIETGLKNYLFFIKENNRERAYIKNGSTWFHQECWNDDYSVYKRKKESKIERIMNL